jgi:hypothetical protein
MNNRQLSFAKTTMTTMTTNNNNNSCNMTVQNTGQQCNKGRLNGNTVIDWIDVIPYNRVQLLAHSSHPASSRMVQHSHQSVTEHHDYDKMQLKPKQPNQWDPR